MLKILALLSLTIQIEAREVLTFLATDWCPYTCKHFQTKGIVGDKIRKILNKEGYDIKVVFLPWARALRMVNNDNIAGLLTAVKSEAPNLVYPSKVTMSYQNCAFSTNKKFIGKIKNANDLRKYKVGHITDYSYGNEYDQVIKKDNPRFISLAGSNPIERLFEMNKLGRIDLFMEEMRVADYNFKKEVFKIHCTKPEGFYTAINPKFKSYKKLIEMLNNGL